MKFKYDITIVITVPNNEKNLSDCINSLIDQTYNFKKMELILLHDESNQTISTKCKKYAEKYSNIIFIDSKKKGIPQSRNLGIKNARGKFIMMLDGNDMLIKETIENAISFFKKHDEEIDLVTYSMVYLKENDKIIPETKYNMYKSGTGVYDLEDYPYLEQSNHNIIIKNKKVTLYDAKAGSMFDIKFNTDILMKKRKIGFCKEACYICRRDVSYIPKTNPYYCFEEKMAYSAYVIKKYLKNDHLPKYIQGIIINDISKRILSDELFPYHYEKKEYDSAISTMRNILKYLDIEMIMNHPSMKKPHKYYLLKSKKAKIDVNFIDDKNYEVYADKVKIGSFSSVSAFITHFYVKNNEITIDGTINDPIIETDSKLFLTIIDNKGDKKKVNIKLSPSNLSYHLTNIKTNNYYNFEAKIDIKSTSEFYFNISLKNKELPLRYEFSKWVPFNMKLKRYNIVYKNKKIIFKNKSKKFTITKNTFLKQIKKVLKENIEYMKVNPKIVLFRFLGRTNKEIWLYQDRVGLRDNGYVQYLNDMNKKDGIKRYYIGSKDDNDIKNLVQFKSLKHKILYLRCSKIITSFKDFGEYCPLTKMFDYYRDIMKYDLIYLQHGILHAKLIRMYSKEYTEIKKIVVSSDFEANNLINNYHYKKKDLIQCGMPRMNEIPKKNTQQSKILFAPSWRNYLIGNIVNNKRKPMEEVFLKSDFYNKINSFLKSEELESILISTNSTLEFKLHPIFKCYKDLFKFKNERIKISFDDVNIGDYSIFITDFSSFQFDFARIETPIIYFLPDEKEFKAGLHTYRELDLNQKDAFGAVCRDEKELIKEINKIIKHKYIPDKKYKDRMAAFFTIDKNPCQTIYSEIKRMEK